MTDAPALVLINRVAGRFLVTVDGKSHTVFDTHDEAETCALAFVDAGAILVDSSELTDAEIAALQARPRRRSRARTAAGRLAHALASL
jgi:hypothetical protein